MSVMTAEEQRRRAAATRGRALEATAPGQQTATAREQRPGPATAQRRGAAGQGIRHLTVVPSTRASRAPRPTAAGAAPAGAARAARPGAAAPAEATGAARPDVARPGVARPDVPRPGAARPDVPRPGVVRPETARAEMAQPRPVRTRTRARLTRRGRIVVAALITAGVVLVAALAWLAGTVRAEAAGSGPPASAVYHSLRSVVVQPGESLWAIAEQADPAGDPRSVMQEIIDINALRGTSVQPGQRLWLPRG
jgi:LysM domain